MRGRPACDHHRLVRLVSPAAKVSVSVVRRHIVRARGARHQHPLPTQPTVILCRLTEFIATVKVRVSPVAPPPSMTLGTPMADGPSAEAKRLPHYTVAGPRGRCPTWPSHQLTP